MYINILPNRKSYIRFAGMHLLKPSRPFILIALTSFLVSCESAFDTRPITRKYSSQLEQVSLGMTKQQLKTVLPKVNLRGQNIVDGKQVDAYELNWFHTERMQGDRVTERLWFYFCQDRLVRWGGPNDWPTTQELNVNIRYR